MTIIKKEIRNATSEREIHNLISDTGIFKKLKQYNIQWNQNKAQYENIIHFTNVIGKHAIPLGKLKLMLNGFI